MESSETQAGGGSAASSSAPGGERPRGAISHEHSNSLPAMLQQLELSVLLSTYQAGRVVSIGSHQGQLCIGFSRFDQAMGLARTPTGIAVGSNDSIWALPASRQIASRIKPEGEHDIAFLARSAHHSRPSSAPGHQAIAAISMAWPWQRTAPAPPT